MEGLSKTPESLAEILFLAGFSATTTGIQAAEMNAPADAEAQIARTCRPASRVIGDVVLHARSWVDLDLDGINRASKTWI